MPLQRKVCWLTGCSSTSVMIVLYLYTYQKKLIPRFCCYTVCMVCVHAYVFVYRCYANTVPVWTLLLCPCVLYLETVVFQACGVDGMSSWTSLLWDTWFAHMRGFKGRFEYFRVTLIVNAFGDTLYNEACTVQTVHNTFAFKSHTISFSGHGFKTYTTKHADSCMYRRDTAQRCDFFPQ